MKRRIRYDRLIILILVVIMAVVVLVLGIKFLFFNNGSSTTVDKPVNTEEVDVERSDKVDISLDAYNVYSSDELDFRFVIGEFTFTSKDNKAIEFDLSKLETNELITLNNIDSYINQIQSLGYSTSKMGIDTSIKSKTESVKVKLLIPVTKQVDNIILTNLNDSTQISIDLTVNAGNLEEFKNSSGEVISGETYDIYVSNAYVSTTMYHNDSEYTYPSTVKVYTFKLTVDNIEEGTSIEAAYFIPDGSSEEYQALDASFSSLKDENIIGVPLKANDTYALFFELYNPDDSGITYNGTLQLKLAGSDDVIEISTTLQ